SARQHAARSVRYWSMQSTTYRRRFAPSSSCEEASVDETAKVLGIKSETVRTRLRRARRMLRDSLGEQFAAVLKDVFPFDRPRCDALIGRLLIEVDVEHLRLCYVATVTPDGKPNLSPKGSLKVWDDETVVFADIASPGTMRNLRSNPFVEINLVDPFLRRGFR